MRSRLLNNQRRCFWIVFSNLGGGFTAIFAEGKGGEAAPADL